MPCKNCGSDSGGTSELALPLTSETSTCGTCSQPKASCGCEAFCEEDHTQTIIKKRYGYTLRIKNSFVWPEPGQVVSLFTESVDRLSVGSILWHPTAGYLHVTSFDPASQIIVADNQGEACNEYTGGESLPECTDFVVGPPSCGTGSIPIDNIPYLAADFISPAEGECALASVTTISGLTVNDTVSLIGYEYRIGAILGNDIIELCNEGNGAPEGTVVLWDGDGDGVPDIPVIVIASENPCTRSGIVAGIILACDGGSVAKPLVGSLDGQIPVWNNVTQRYELKNIDVAISTCVALTADLTTDVAHVGSYPVSVTDTSAFIAGDVIVIDSLLYTVNVVDSGVLMHITPLATPIGVIVYTAGTPVCTTPENDCTRATETEGVLLICKAGVGAPLDGAVMGHIPVLQDATTNEASYEIQGGNVYQSTSPSVDDELFGSGPTTLVGALATVVIPNPSSTRFLHILLCMAASILAEYDEINTGPTFTYTMYREINGGGFVAVSTEQEQPPYTGAVANVLNLKRRLHFFEVMTIAPGGSVTVSCRTDVNITGSGRLEVTDLESRIDAMVTMG